MIATVICGLLWLLAAIAAIAAYHEAITNGEGDDS